MEIAIAVGSLKLAYSLLITGIKVEQVPNAVRRCIELVRTCHRDLDDLIKLRNESLPMLTSKPAILERINIIIQNAHNGLLEVARLVEKLRPEAHDGSSPLMGRLEWLFVDSREFASQEPLISRQHSSVIAELNFLRQLILLAPLIDGAVSARDKDNTTQKTENPSMIAWDNVGLLDEMLGGNKRVLGQHNPPTSHTSTSTIPATTANDQPVGQALADPPPPYSSPKPISTFPSTLSAASTNPVVYNVAVPVSGAPLAAGLDTIYSSKSQPSIDMKRRTTTFDPDGIAFLFGDIKLTPKDNTSSVMQSPLPISPPSLSSPQFSLSTPSPQWSDLSSVNPTPPHQRHSTPSGGYSMQPSARPMSQPIMQQPGTELQSQQQSPYAPQIPPKQQHIPSTKPLSTIPPELIHRHDHLEPQQQPIFPPLPPAINTARPSSATGPGMEAAPPIQQQIWGQNPNVQANQSHREHTRCSSSCGATTPMPFSPPMSSTPTIGIMSLHQSSQWPLSVSGQLEGDSTTTVTCSQNQHHSASISQRPAASEYGAGAQIANAGLIASKRDYSQSLRSVPTYATLREHWDPEHLTGVHQGIATSTPPVDHSGNIIGAVSGYRPSANEEQEKRTKTQQVHTEIHELPAVAFEPDPFELP